MFQIRFLTIFMLKNTLFEPVEKPTIPIEKRTIVIAEIFSSYESN